MRVTIHKSTDDQERKPSGPVTHTCTYTSTPEESRLQILKETAKKSAYIALVLYSMKHNI